MKASLKPHKAHAQQNCEAWWYEYQGRIEIYIRTLDTGPTVTCTISKRALKAYLTRVDKKP